MEKSCVGQESVSESESESESGNGNKPLFYQRNKKGLERNALFAEAALVAACNEFCSNGRPAKRSKFFSHFRLTSVFTKFGFNEYSV